MNVVAEMLLTEPAPAVIWATLMLLTLPALLVLGSPAGVRHPRRALREALAVLGERGRVRRELAERAARAEQFAVEVGSAADRAATAADRWQDHWERTERTAAEAWQSWIDADARLRQEQAAAAFGIPWTPPTCAEYASRERYLHRVVRAAVERGELPAAALDDALAGEGGWDARLHPLEQSLAVRRASAAYLRERYESAVTAERRAWHDAELARRSSDSLQREAAAAGREAAGLRHLITDRPVPAVSPRPRRLFGYAGIASGV